MSQINLILLGAPGAGKGTQSEKLVNEYKVPQISTGDILRRERAIDSDLGKEAGTYMDSGRLVPDDVVIRMVEKRIEEDDCAKGFILDGFPRTIEQANKLTEILEKKAKTLTAVINIIVADEVLEKRLLGRRKCPKCGENYNTFFNPPQKKDVCDKCGTTLEQRKDDNLETIRQRFDVYQRQTSPLIDYYQNQGVYVAIKGKNEVDEIYNQVRQEVERLRG